MSGQIRRKTFSGQGRKPRQGVQRSECGRIVKTERGETAEQAMATALDARVRVLGAPADNAADKAWGSAIGRLYLAGAVAAGHLQVATRYARLKAITAILDDVRSSYGVPVLARLSCGFGRDPYERFDPEAAWDATEKRRREAIIARVRADHEAVVSALWDMQGDPLTSGAGFILDRVVMWDEIEHASDSRGQVLLRAALNRLERLWKVGLTRGESWCTPSSSETT